MTRWFRTERLYFQNVLAELIHTAMTNTVSRTVLFFVLNFLPISNLRAHNDRFQAFAINKTCTKRSIPCAHFNAAVFWEAATRRFCEEAAGRRWSGRRRTRSH